MRRQRDGFHVWPVFTDLMSGIALMLLVLGVRTSVKADHDRQRAEDQLQRAAKERDDLKAQLKKEQKKYGVKEEIVEKIRAKLPSQMGVKINKQGNLEISADVLFASNEYRIPPASISNARTLGAALVGLFEDDNTSRSISMLMVTGHTDQDGPADGNLTLSTKRAISLVDLWQKQYFRDSDTSAAQRCIAAKIVAVGMGESRPLVIDETLGGKPGGECHNQASEYLGCRANRRIEIRVIPKDQEVMEIEGCK